MNIVKAISSERLFKPFFKDLATWETWLTYLRSLYAFECVNENDLSLIRDCAGLEEWPKEPFKESYVIAGRRSGKSSIVAVIACWLAIFHDWSKHLSVGERGYIFIISVNKAQGAIIKNYVGGILESQPHFKSLVKKILVDEIELTNGITIAIKPASFRTLRGYTVLCAILEELSFWRFEVESANPDKEIVRALRPALGNIPGSMLIGISSPFAKSGFLYEQFEKWYGKRGGPLVWRAPTQTMNPTYSKEKIAEAYADDPVAAATEYGAEFRADLAGFVDPEIVDDCVVPGRHGLSFAQGIEYHAFLDTSGARSDSMTIAIAHRSKGKVVLDCAHERVPPFVPSEVVEEYSKIIRGYGLHTATADNYAGDWVTSNFRDHGVEVVNTTKTKSEFYLEFLPLLHNGAVEILDSARLVSQLKNLMRSTRGGKEKVDHGPGAHDDVINAVAGACVAAALEEDTGPEFVYHGGMGDVQEIQASSSDGESWVSYHGAKSSVLPPESEDIAKAIREEVKQRAKEIYLKHGYVSPMGIAHSIGVSFEVVKDHLLKLGYKEVKKNEFIPKEIDDLN
jgi:hypothetical protein